jgi:D-glycero-alpha-D-manno-heptose-7-phosphate kinase
MTELIVARAPTRIDFAGGTLDIPPLYLFHQPAITINVAINLFATVQVMRRPGRAIRLVASDQGRQLAWPSRERISWTHEPYLEMLARLIQSLAPDGGLNVRTDCQAPAGAGTGGSSALAVATAAALSTVAGRPLTRVALIEYAKSIETQAIRVPTGYQDYYAAAYGGASSIEFGLSGIRRTAIAGRAFLAQLERHLLLLYLGKPRFSGANNWDLFKRHIEGNRKTLALFDALQDNALAMRHAFQAQDLCGIARLLNQDWDTRRRALPTMSSPSIDRLIRSLRRAGAVGARVCGAGGGGCLALIIEPEARAKLIALAEAAGAKSLPSAINTRGLVVRRSKESFQRSALSS